MFPVLEAYRIESLLGRGGMGEVFLAFDERLGRRVAIKILRSDLALEPDARAHFLREARAVARLNHPSIVQIYDVLQDAEGRDCIVMEYVEGTTLGDLQAGKPLHLELALRLAEEIAEGLAQAHAQGLVHRDLKASNVMVTPESSVKILDFGLARPLWGDDQSRSLSTGIAGTPHAMSPEQAMGDPVDHRSDLFAFGALLYEMLIGRSPFRAATALGTIQRVIHEDPPPPHELRSDLPDELSRLIVRLLEKDPMRRPPSLRIVATELERMRASMLEVVAEQPPSSLLRLDEMVTASLPPPAVAIALPHTPNEVPVRSVHLKRNLKRWFAVAAVTLLLILASAGFYAAQQREQVALREQQSQALLDFLLGDLRGELQSAGKLDLLDQIDEQALEYFTAVPETALTTDELRVRSKAMHQLGQAQLARGHFDKASTAMQRALDMARAYVERKPDDDEGLFELAQAHFWVGYLHWQEYDLDLAMERFESYLQVAQQLTKRDPEKVAWKMEEAYARSNLASLHEERGEIDQALLALETSARIFEGLLAGSHSNIELLGELATVYAKLGEILKNRGELVAATARFQAHLDLLRRVSAQRPEDMETLRLLGFAYGHVADILRMRGQLDEAIELYRTELATAQLLTATDPENKLWASDEARCHNKLARTLLLSPSSNEAEEHLDQQRTILEKLLAHDPDHRNWRHLNALEHLVRAELLLLQGRDAREQAQTATSILDPLCMENDNLLFCYTYGQSLSVLAEVRQERELLVEARRLVQKLTARMRVPSHLGLLVQLNTALGEADTCEQLIIELETMGYRDPLYELHTSQ